MWNIGGEMYYAYIINDILSNGGQAPLIAENLENIEISEEIYNNLDKYIWDKSAKTLLLNPNYDEEQLEQAKEDKNLENTMKAKMAVENGYVEFKNAQFETNAQTVGDLTATMLWMQTYGIETYTWLSKDDKIVTLTLADFGILGGLIAGYKAHIWNEEYLSFKTQIDNAETVEEVKTIEIEY